MLPGMIRALQIIAVLLFLGVMTAIHQGAGAFLRWGGPDFTSGFLVGAIGTVLFGFFLHWLDSRSRRRRGWPHD